MYILKDKFRIGECNHSLVLFDWSACNIHVKLISETPTVGETHSEQQNTTGSVGFNTCLLLIVDHSFLTNCVQSARLMVPLVAHFLTQTQCIRSPLAVTETLIVVALL